ncbi:MAG: NusA-like transcription termination signal-binding factor [Candidatus Brockarchaeota archaeon]|nr:NusA-like transcription termination signal-binding factor [Candidatus Brockarchaeota archaeon]
MRKGNAAQDGLRVRLTGEDMKHISLFEGFTGAAALDCIVDREDEAIFIVSPGQGGRIRYSAIRKLEQMIKRPVVTIEYSEDPLQFIRNSLSPAKVLEVKMVEHPDGRKTASVIVSASDRGKAIGKGGKVAQRTRALAKRYHGIDNVHIV